MGGIPAHFIVNPSATTKVATSITAGNTTPATAVSVHYMDKPHVTIGFENTSATEIQVSRQPITINGQGTTVAGTAVYFMTLPPYSFRTRDIKANSIGYGPAVYGIYGANIPASGTVCLYSDPAK